MVNRQLDASWGALIGQDFSNKPPAETNAHLEDFERQRAEGEPALLAWTSAHMSRAFRRCIDPQDVVQEVWCRLIEKYSPADFAGKTTFRPRMFAVARFVLIEMSRQLGRCGRGSGYGAVKGHAVAEHLDRTSVTRLVMTNESLGLLSTLLDAWDPEARQLLIRRVIEGLTLQEIALADGMSLARVKKRWQRLRGRLALDQAVAGLLS